MIYHESHNFLFKQATMATNSKNKDFNQEFNNISDDDYKDDDDDDNNNNNNNNTKTITTTTTTTTTTITIMYIQN